MHKSTKAERTAVTLKVPVIFLNLEAGCVRAMVPHHTEMLRYAQLRVRPSLESAQLRSEMLRGFWHTAIFWSNVPLWMRIFKKKWSQFLTFWYCSGFRENIIEQMFRTKPHRIPHYRGNKKPVLHLHLWCGFLFSFLVCLACSLCWFCSCQEEKTWSLLVNPFHFTCK